MQQHLRGSFKLFRLAGIDIRLHWLWFAAVAFHVGAGQATRHPLWRLTDILALFAIVLAHELGHALACRSVGGTARDIILWPLGGIAYVAPPPRPGAVLWSIAAGPLVNLVLIVPFSLLYFLGPAAGWPELHLFFARMALANVIMFLFNMLPIYPLDGGQILHALLWFSMGRWSSLQAASAVGLAFGGLLFLVSLVFLPVAARFGSEALFSLSMLWIIAFFLAIHSLAAFQMSRHALYMERLPRHTECACPACLEAPPKGPFWRCEECGHYFDTFDSRGMCPSCGMWYLQTRCIHCGQSNHIDRWLAYRPGLGLAPAPPEE
jgi:Zn-dependent protease